MSDITHDAEADAVYISVWRGNRTEETEPPKRPDLDLRDPGIQAEIRHEIAMLSPHPENAAIDDWIDVVFDWAPGTDWRDDEAMTRV